MPLNMYNSLARYSLGTKRKPANDPPNFVASNNTAIMKEDRDDCAISEKGEYILSCHSSNGAYLSKNYGSTFDKVFTLTKGCCAISYDGKYMLYGGWSGVIHRSEDYGNIDTFSPCSLSKNWKRIRMSFDGKYCLASTYNNYVYLSNNFGVSFTETTITTSAAMEDVDIAMSKTGQYMISIKKNSSTNDLIRISSNSGASWTEKTLTGLTNFATSCALSEDGQTAFIGSRGYENLYKITNLSDTSPTVELIPGALNIKCGSISVSSDGLYIFISDIQTAKMYYSTNGGSVFKLISVPINTINISTVAMTPDARIIIGNNRYPFNNYKLFISNA